MPSAPEAGGAAGGSVPAGIMPSPPSRATATASSAVPTPPRVASC